MCCRRSLQKSCKASGAARAGGVGTTSVSVQPETGGEADSDCTNDAALLSSQRSAGRFAGAIVGFGGQPGSLRLSQADCAVEARRMEGERDESDCAETS